MKIYTSYWAQVRNFPTTLIGLNTTIFPPRWRKLGQDNRGVWVIDCPPLKSGHNCDGLCNGKCAPKHPQDCKFLYEYKRQLDDIDFAFIFFEKYDNPCSERWAVQRWLKEHECEISEWHIEQ